MPRTKLNEIPKERIPRGVVYNRLDELSGLNKYAAIATITKEFKFTQSTAETYYGKWRKEFMKLGHIAPKLEQNSVKKDVLQPKELTKKITKVAVTKVIDEIVKAETKRLDHYGDIKLLPVIPILKAEKIAEIERLKAEEQKRPAVFIEDNFNGFVPLVIKGKFLSYELTKEGVCYGEGFQDNITDEFIEEQRRALEIWKNYKDVI